MSARATDSLTAPVEILSISGGQWRVRDGSRPADDATSLLGFIGRVGDLFEVTVLCAPRERHYTATLDSAVAFARNYRPAMLAERPAA